MPDKMTGTLPLLRHLLTAVSIAERQRTRSDKTKQNPAESANEGVQLDT